LNKDVVDCYTDLKVNQMISSNVSIVKHSNYSQDDFLRF